MTRELTSHKVNGLNEALTITVLDEPGIGGACHRYEMSFIGQSRKNLESDEIVATRFEFDVAFQNGPIQQVGVNGISNEALLAIVEDRLKGFAAGPFACRENAIALTHVQDAMHWLHHRTRERIARGVEGTLQK